MAISTAVIVVLIMGTVTVIQEIYEIRHERRSVELRLRESLLPLVASIEEALSVDDIREEIARYHEAYITNGRLDHHLILRDGNGALVMSTVSANTDDRRKYSRIAVPVTNPALGDEHASLTVLQGDTQFWENLRDRWRHWAIHFGATLVTILIFLQITIRRLVTGPLERLLDGIRKTEMGYWGEVEKVDGAWEVQWINWRFRMMGLELKRTVHQLLDAERRANVPVLASASEAGESDTSTLRETVIPPKVEVAGAVRFLEKRCRELEEDCEPSPRKLAMAREAMGRHALLAERMGAMELKSRLENAALIVLEPDRYEKLENQLAQFTRENREWLAGCMMTLRRALDRQMVPLYSLRYRVKHTAGVWRKMQAKGLTIEQVHDLFALRIVVPTESDCYWALRVVHENFIPVVGRFKDYIATPKSNGYRSIHTCVQSREGQIFEVQIRSIAMHEIAEHGSASHLSYKKENPAPVVPSRRIRGWPRRIFEFLARRLDREHLFLVAAIVVIGAVASLAIAETPNPPPAPAINEFCPVTPGEKVDPKIFVTDGDQTIAFCCKRCRNKYLQDPGAYGEATVRNGQHSSPHKAGSEAVTIAADDHGQSASGHIHDHAVDHAQDSGGRAVFWTRAGRLHPLAIHFPIALLISALFAELLAMVNPRSAARSWARYCLWLGTMGALVAAPLGWGAAAGAPYPGLEQTLLLHRWLGISSAILAAVALAIATIGDRRERSGLLLLYRVSLGITATLVVVAGHLGATLVYGANFLTQ